MVRTILAFSMVALVAVTAGCRMCAHPYDYCGPLFTGDGCGPSCAPDARAGSILAGGCPSCGYASTAESELGPDAVPTPADEPPAQSDGPLQPGRPSHLPEPDDYVGPPPKPLPELADQLDPTRPIRLPDADRTAQSWRPIKR